MHSLPDCARTERWWPHIWYWKYIVLCSERPLNYKLLFTSESTFACQSTWCSIWLEGIAVFSNFMYQALRTCQLAYRTTSHWLLVLPPLPGRFHFLLIHEEQLCIWGIHLILPLHRYAHQINKPIDIEYIYLYIPRVGSSAYTLITWVTW